MVQGPHLSAQISQKGGSILIMMKNRLVNRRTTVFPDEERQQRAPIGDWIYGRPGRCRRCGENILITSINTGLCEKCSHYVFSQGI